MSDDDDVVEVKEPQGAQVYHVAITFQAMSWLDKDTVIAEKLPHLRSFIDLIGADKWYATLERGKKTVNGHLHFQTYAHLKSKKRVKEVIALANTDRTRWGERMHIRPSSKAGVAKLKAYCVKVTDETYVAGPWGHKGNPEELIEEAMDAAMPEPPAPEVAPLSGWQIPAYYEIWDVGSMKWREPDPRKVWVIVDEKGNSGKSHLAKYCVWKHKALFIKSGESDRMIDMIYNKRKHLRCVFFDLPRDVDDKAWSARAASRRSRSPLIQVRRPRMASGARLSSSRINACPRHATSATRFTFGRAT